jgi:hypothetical protein
MTKKTRNIPKDFKDNHLRRISDLLHKETFGMSEEELDNILKKSKQNHLKDRLIKSKKSKK